MRGPSRVEEGTRARISGLSVDAAAGPWGRGVVVGGGVGGDGGVDIVVRQANFVYDTHYG